MGVVVVAMLVAVVGRGVMVATIRGPAVAGLILSRGHLVRYLRTHSDRGRGAPARTLPAMSSVPDDHLLTSLRSLDADGRWLFALRTLRMFGYGFLAVVLVLYLIAAGLDPLGDRGPPDPDARR